MKIYLLDKYDLANLNLEEEDCIVSNPYTKRPSVEAIEDVPWGVGLTEDQLFLLGLSQRDRSYADVEQIFWANDKTGTGKEVELEAWEGQSHDDFIMSKMGKMLNNSDIVPDDFE